MSAIAYNRIVLLDELVKLTPEQAAALQKLAAALYKKNAVEHGLIVIQTKRGLARWIYFLDQPFTIPRPGQDDD